MKDICKIINRNINRGKVTRICSSNLKLLLAIIVVLLLARAIFLILTHAIGLLSDKSTD